MEITYATLYYYTFTFPNGHTTDQQYFADPARRDEECGKASRLNGIESDTSDLEHPSAYKGTVSVILAEGEYYTLSPITVRS